MDWPDTERVLQTAAMPVLLWGPPGTGKTTAAIRSARSPQHVWSITITEEMPAAEVRGFFVPAGREFRFNDGPGLAAFRRGELLVINELDKASGDAHTFLLNLLDDPVVASIAPPGVGEVVRPAKGWRVVATMNEDPAVLPDALADRFPYQIHVTRPHPSILERLPRELRGVAARACELEDTDRRVSIRAWLAYAALRTQLGDELAAAATFGARADDVLASLKVGQAPA